MNTENATWEQRIIFLEDSVKNLQRQLTRANDYIAIQNLASEYQYYHQPKTMGKTMDLFAQKTPGVSVGISAGVDEGIDRVRAFWGKESVVPIEGVMLEHQLTTPMIEVSEDGQTAKGVWMSPGHETVPGLLDGGHWVWGRYAADFVKEDGKWKIWHLWFYCTLRVRCGQDYADGPEAPSEALIAHKERVEFSHPLPYVNIYTRESIREMVPVPPAPYSTFESYDPTGGAPQPLRGMPPPATK